MTQQSHSQAYSLKKPKLRDTCIPLFTAALFTIARIQKQPRFPLTDEWIKNLWYIYTVEYFSAIKRNAFESVLMRQMNLEPIIQSEVNKVKNKYRIPAHIYEIQKNGTGEPICRAVVETQTEKTDLWAQWGKEKVGQIERIAWKHTLPYVKQIASGNFLYDAGSSNPYS